jgi:hypothetical protein
MFATCWWTGGVNFVVMSCYEMSSYYADLVFNLFQIDLGILTTQNSYALQWRSLRIAVYDWHRALTNELVCTPPLNVRVNHCESQCLDLFTLGRRHVPS